MLIRDLRSELVAGDAPAAAVQLARYHALLESFCKDWRQMYLLHGVGEPMLVNSPICATASAKSRRHGRGSRGAHQPRRRPRGSRGRVLRPMLTAAAAPTRPARRIRAVRPRPAAPVFIVAAPRSGNTLLFETLAASDQLVTVGGEARWLVEASMSFASARRVSIPIDWAPTPTRLSSLAACMPRCPKAGGFRGAPGGCARRAAPLEKTRRIPCASRSSTGFFPTPCSFSCGGTRASLSSLMEAWRSGDWQTYRELDGLRGRGRWCCLGLARAAAARGK